LAEGIDNLFVIGLVEKASFRREATLFQSSPFAIIAGPCNEIIRRDHDRIAGSFGDDLVQFGIPSLEFLE